MASRSDAAPTGRRDEIMSLRTVVVVCVVGALLFTIAFYAILSSQDIEYPNEPGNNSFSVSAVGQSAFVELLRSLGIKIEYHRYQPEGHLATAEGNFFMLAEPPHSRYVPGMVKLLSGASAILIVLPKRTAINENRQDKWAERVELLGSDHVTEIAQSAIDDAKLVRPEGKVSWQTNSLGVEPLIHDLQLLQSEKLKTIVGGTEGMLVGEIIQDGGPRIWLLSDADVLSNHGIDDGDNATFAVRLVEALRPADRPVYIDETMHGILQPPQVWASLFELPLFAVTIAFCALCIVIGLSALVRFGRTVDSPAALAAGKDLLLSNTANLILNKSSTMLLVVEYVRNLKRDMAVRFNAPAGLDERELDRWLARVVRGEAENELREQQLRLAALEGSPQAAAAALAVARRVHTWRGRVLGDAR